MSDYLLLVNAGLFMVAFSIFALWFLRWEYKRRGALSWFGSFIHIAMYGVHGMFCALLAWGPDTIPPMSVGGGVGIALMAVGLAITFYAMDLFRTFGRWLGCATPGLATGGLYRFSRNPQFVGYGLVFLGFFIAWWTPPAPIGLISYAGLVYLIARVEEEHLTRVYGSAYLDYCARVPRFIGLPGK